jgi:SH3-like domain-containing protein
MVTRRFPGCRFAIGPRRAALAFLIAVSVSGVSSCRSSRQPRGSSSQPSIGVAYVGPATMNLRQDLAVRSASIVEVKHGDRLEILEARRRLVRVRTAEGMEGWADASLLLTAGQMDQLTRLSEAAKNMPSQGMATVFDQLNVHTEPDRFSPSFAQIPENGSVEVLAHQVAPRKTSRPRNALTVRTSPSRPAKRDSKKAAASALPIPSSAAALPAEWERMSRPRASDLPGYVAPAAPAPPPVDDWNLVRMKDGKAGWVLARMLYMAIPDEVAQYAEGKRIAAYLAIGDVQDGDQVRHNWLWTTATSGLNPGDFDGLRVFVWSKNRHRYETAYIERNLTGFFPVQVADVPGGEKGFSLLAQDRDGLVYKRTYAFSGYRVRLLSKILASQPDLEAATRATLLTEAVSQPAQAGGWWRKVSAWPRSWFSRR